MSSLVEAGFTPEEAIKIATANGASYLFEWQKIAATQGEVCAFDVMRFFRWPLNAILGCIFLLLAWRIVKASLRAAAAGIEHENAVAS